MVMPQVLEGKGSEDAEDADIREREREREREEEKARVGGSYIAIGSWLRTHAARQHSAMFPMARLGAAQDGSACCTGELEVQWVVERL